MKTLLKRFVPAVLLLTASGALAESPLQGPSDAPAREVLGTTRPQPAVEDQVKELTQTVQSLDAQVKQLRALEAERPAPNVDLGGPNDHPLWP